MAEIYQSGNLTVFFEEIIRIRFAIIGTAEELIVRLGKPQADAVYKFYCPYQIETSQYGLKQHSAGADELKSVQNAMAMINADLKRLVREKHLVLKRDGHGEGDFGFEEYEALYLMRNRATLKYDSTLSQVDKLQLEKTVRLLEEESDKRARARFSPEMQAMREKRKNIVKNLGDKGEK